MVKSISNCVDGKFVMVHIPKIKVHSICMNSTKLLSVDSIRYD